jgi:hypothetical protein
MADAESGAQERRRNRVGASAPSARCSFQFGGMVLASRRGFCARRERSDFGSVDSGDRGLFGIQHRDPGIGSRFGYGKPLLPEQVNVFLHSPLGLVKAVLDGMPDARKSLQIGRIKPEVVGFLGRFDYQRIRKFYHTVTSPVLLQPCRLENTVACAGRDFLGPVIVHSNEFRPPGFAVVPDRSLFFHDTKTISIQKADKLTGFHLSPISIPEEYRGPVTAANRASMEAEGQKLGPAGSANRQNQELGPRVFSPYCAKTRSAKKRVNSEECEGKVDLISIDIGVSMAGQGE